MMPSPERVPRSSKLRSTSSRPTGLRPAPPCSSRSLSSRCSAMSASRPVQSITKSTSTGTMPCWVRTWLTIRSPCGSILSTVPIISWYQPSLAPGLHLLLPVAAVRRVGAAHPLVERGPVLALELAHLPLELAAPHRLRVVEALVGPPVGALAPHEPAAVGFSPLPSLAPLMKVRKRCTIWVCASAQQPIVHEPLQHPGRDDAAAAHQHGAGRRHQSLVDVLVRLVGVDDVVVVLVLRAVGLQLGEELQPRIADGDVHEAGPERDPLGRR